MAKNLTFTLNKARYEAAPVKIERKKLYGWSDLIALDSGGEECSLVSVDETGSLIIPKGGTGIGILSPEGKWVDRSSLKAITADGKDAPLVPSSYDAPIALDNKAGPECLLGHTITAFYQLDGPPEFAAAIGKDIFTFPFNPRSDYEGSDAFLLAAGGAVFMLLGYDSSFGFIGLEQAENIEEAESEAAEEEDGDIDFAMF